MFRELGMTEDELSRCSQEELMKRLARAEENSQKLKGAADDRVHQLRAAIHEKRRPKTVSREQFAKDVGCPYIQGDIEVGPNYWTTGWVFENGAFTNGQEHCTPSDNKFHRAKMQLQYLQLCEKRWVKRFNDLKQEAMQAGQLASSHAGVPSITESDIEGLKEIQSRILDLRERMKPHQELLAQSPEAIAKRQRAEERKEEQLKTKQLLDQARQVNV